MAKYRMIETNQAGRVKFFNPKVMDNGEAKMNWGFIRLEGEFCSPGEGEHAECNKTKCVPGTVFVHGHDVRQDSWHTDIVALKDGDNVVFDVALDGRSGKRKAVNVIRVATA